VAHLLVATDKEGKQPQRVHRTHTGASTSAASASAASASALAGLSVSDSGVASGSEMIEDSVVLVDAKEMMIGGGPSLRISEMAARGPSEVAAADERERIRMSQITDGSDWKGPGSRSGSGVLVRHPSMAARESNTGRGSTTYASIVRSGAAAGANRAEHLELSLDRRSVSRSRGTVDTEGINSAVGVAGEGADEALLAAMAGVTPVIAEHKSE